MFRAGFGNHGRHSEQRDCAIPAYPGVSLHRHRSRQTVVPGLLARAEPAARLAGAAQRSELLCGPSTPHTHTLCASCQCSTSKEQTWLFRAPALCLCSPFPFTCLNCTCENTPGGPGAGGGPCPGLGVMLDEN